MGLHEAMETPPPLPLPQHHHHDSLGLCPFDEPHFEMEMNLLMMSSLTSQYYGCNIIGSLGLVSDDEDTREPISSSSSSSTIINDHIISPIISALPRPTNLIYTTTSAKDYASCSGSSIAKAQRLIFQHYEARSLKIKKPHPPPSSHDNKVGVVPYNNKPMHHDEENESVDVDVDVNVNVNVKVNGHSNVQYREAISPILNLKHLHGWITWWLIHLFTRGGEAILDLACGNGGDLARWDMACAGSYVGVDMVSSLLECARLRHITSRYSYEAWFVCADAFAPSLLRAIRPAQCGPEVSRGGRVHMSMPGVDDDDDDIDEETGPYPSGGTFDVCSCQFALHYAWSSEERARAAIANVAASLKPGGYFIGTVPDADTIVAKLGAVAASDSRGPAGRNRHKSFGNSLYRITFDGLNSECALLLRSRRRLVTETEASAPTRPAPTAVEYYEASDFGIQYNFFLADAVHDCPEWLVPLPSLIGLAREHGLGLVSASNFHEFLREHKSHHEYHLHLHNHPMEWDCASTYLAFAFQKQFS